MPGPRLHHPAILRVAPLRRGVPAGYFIEFGGAITQAAWVPAAGRVADTVEVLEVPSAPAFDEEYFEWLDLLEAIEQAKDSFVMVELGAGYGRWSVRGALVARAAGLEARCVAVEAEPTHARWLRCHFLDNDLVPDEHELIWGAVGAEAGFVPFRTGEARSHYGQHIERHTDVAYPTARERRRLRARSVLGRPPRASAEARACVWVPSIPLVELLVPYPVVDLLDVDIQGAELQVLAAAMQRLDAQVRRVHVGTHSADIERGLRRLFTDHGWQNAHDYPGQSVAETRYGPIRFVDGVQSWINPEAGEGGRVPGAAPAARDSDVARLYERVRSLKNKVTQLRAERDALRGTPRPGPPAPGED